MKDPSYAIRKAYFDELDGNLSVNGNNVPVYDRVPDKPPSHYVLIAEQTAVDESSKGCFGVDATVLLDVVTRFKKGGGKKDADVISNQITQRIIDHESYPDASPEFKIYGVMLENMNTLESMEPSEYVVRKLIRIRNLVQQI